MNQPVTADPLAEANRGLVATAGFGGSPMGTGAISGGTNQPAPPVGGGSGGGSGGWIVLEALEIDLSQAGAAAITALGGRGGPGRNNAHDVVGAGGNGGPGVVQLHTPSGTAAELLLPAASDVGDLTSPDGVVLLPVLGG